MQLTQELVCLRVMVNAKVQQLTATPWVSPAVLCSVDLVHISFSLMDTSPFDK